MFWKSYFVFIVLISIPLYMSGASGESLEFITDLGFLVIQLIGIYGLAWEKKIFSRMFWRIYFPLCVAWNLGHAYFTFDGTITVVFTLMYSPLLLGTYLYAFQRDNLWSQEAVFEERQPGSL